MKLIAITRESFFESEALLIMRLLDGRIDRVHVRKPGASEKGMRQLLDSIDETYLSRISLHDHFSLTREYDVGGVHLNRRNPEVPVGFAGIISCSCHSLKELEAASDVGYAFLSPVFDSISKAGYSSAFSIETLKQAAFEGILNNKTIALGGVTPEKLPLLESIGFGGVALLGYVWTYPDYFCKTE
jgi:Thiamine monophosphate synthase